MEAGIASGRLTKRDLGRAATGAVAATLLGLDARTVRAEPALARPLAPRSEFGFVQASGYLTGDGSLDDMERLARAMRAAADFAQPIQLEAGKAYRWRAQIRPPTGFPGFVADPGDGSEFHFHAADTFTSKTRPTDPAAADGHLIYVERIDGFRWENIKLFFHAEQRSWVHGLCIRGGRGQRIVGFEATGFCAGFVLKIDSARDWIVENPHIHDCTLDVPSPKDPNSGQLTGIGIDDDKLSIDGRYSVSENFIIRNPQIHRLKSSAATIATGPGYQTDGITFIGYPKDPNAGGGLILGGMISECDEGVDHPSGCRLKIVGLSFKDIQLWALKYVHGAQYNEAHDITVDGIGGGAVVFGGSQSRAPTQHNLIKNIDIRRVGDTSTGKMVRFLPPSAIRLDDTADGVTRGNVIENTVTGVSITKSAPDAPMGVLIGDLAAGTRGNRIDDLRHDATVTDPIHNQGLGTSRGLAGKLDIRYAPGVLAAMPDADYTLPPPNTRLVTAHPLSAGRRVNLSHPNQYPAGTVVTVHDRAGSVSSTTPIAVRSPVGSSSIVGSNPALTTPHASASFRSDGISTWLRQDRASGAQPKR